MITWQERKNHANRIIAGTNKMSSVASTMLLGVIFVTFWQTTNDFAKITVSDLENVIIVKLVSFA